MGCDVHPYHEVLKDGKWQFTGKLIKDEEFDSEDYPNGYWLPDSYVTNDKGEYQGKNGRYTRDYLLFGHITGGQVRYAADEANNLPDPLHPRDLPDDLSPEVKLMADQWDGDGHSHSYYTLAELSQYATDLLMAGESQDEGAQAVLNFVKHYRDDSIPLDQQRIVFWFDN